eukprot:321704_1
MSRGGRLTSTGKQQMGSALGGVAELRFLGQMINLRPPSASTKNLISVDLFGGAPGVAGVTSSGGKGDDKEKEITISRVVKDGELVKVMAELDIEEEAKDSR